MSCFLYFNDTFDYRGTLLKCIIIYYSVYCS